MEQVEYLSLDGLIDYDSRIKSLIDDIDAKVDGKANSSHNHAASNITSGTLSSDRLPTVPVSKGGTGSTSAAGALTNLGLTATAAEINKLDGVTATTAELNYVDGVTSNIQTQLNSKAALSSPAFTGTPTVPTAERWDDSTKIANTAFVKSMCIGEALYYNASGTTGTITLSDNIGNYFSIGIKYTDGTRYMYREIPTYGNSLVTAVERAIASSAAMYIGSVVLTFNGAIVTRSNVGQLSHHSGTTSEFTTTPASSQEIKIVGIWGIIYDDGI